MAHFCYDPDRCKHPDHIRYGPREPSVSYAERAALERALHRSARHRYFEEIMMEFDDPAVPSAEKRDMFRNLMAPSCLSFKEYGIVPYRTGMAMCFRHKFTTWPKYLFDFDGDFIVILHSPDESKNYAKEAHIPILAIKLSIRTERDEEDPDKETMTMHAHHNMGYYAQASRDSSSL